LPLSIGPEGFQVIPQLAVEIKLRCLPILVGGDACLSTYLNTFPTAFPGSWLYLIVVFIVVTFTALPPGLVQPRIAHIGDRGPDFASDASHPQSGRHLAKSELPRPLP
jgi:hypothetical protein